MLNPNLRIWTEFDLDIDIDKAGEAEKSGRGRIRGIASSENIDADGEVILQDGLDWTWFKAHGFFTLEHPLSAMNVIGEPTELNKTDIEGVPATEVIGELYLTDPIALSVWRKAVAIRKSGGKRRLGMSIEGRVLQRDGNVVKRAEVRSVAISPQPRNEDSWFEPLAASQMGMPPLSMMMQMVPYMAAINAMKGPGAGYGTETVGYPQHAQNITGGIATLVQQSIDPSNANADLDRKAFGRLLDARDKLLMRVLKKFPHLTWSQGLAALEEAQQKLKLEDMEHEGK